MYFVRFMITLRKKILARDMKVPTDSNVFCAVYNYAEKEDLSKGY